MNLKQSGRKDKGRVVLNNLPPEIAEGIKRIIGHLKQEGIIGMVEHTESQGIRVYVLPQYPSLEVRGYIGTEAFGGHDYVVHKFRANLMTALFEQATNKGLISSPGYKIRPANNYGYIRMSSSEVSEEQFLIRESYFCRH